MSRADLPPDEERRLTQTIVVRCANGHPPILYFSRRDAQVPCPLCAKAAQ